MARYVILFAGLSEKSGKPKRQNDSATEIDPNSKSKRPRTHYESQQRSVGIASGLKGKVGSSTKTGSSSSSNFTGATSSAAAAQRSTSPMPSTSAKTAVPTPAPDSEPDMFHADDEHDPALITNKHAVYTTPKDKSKHPLSGVSMTPESFASRSPVTLATPATAKEHTMLAKLRKLQDDHSNVVQMLVVLTGKMDEVLARIRNCRCAAQSNPVQEGQGATISNFSTMDTVEIPKEWKFPLVTMEQLKSIASDAAPENSRSNDLLRYLERCVHDTNIKDIVKGIITHIISDDLQTKVSISCVSTLNGINGSD